MLATLKMGHLNDTIKALVLTKVQQRQQNVDLLLPRVVLVR